MFSGRSARSLKKKQINKTGHDLIPIDALLLCDQSLTVCTQQIKYLAVPVQSSA